MPPLVLLGLGVGALVLALVVAFVALTGGLDQATDGTLAGPTPTAGGSVAPGGGVSSGAPSNVPQSQAAGEVALGTPGVVVASAVVVTGDLVEVSEEVSWPAGGPAEVGLSFPALDQVGGLPDGFFPVVQTLQVTLDGAPVVPEAGDRANTWVVRSVDGDPPSTMSVRYVLAGAVSRSAPSQPGRALAVVAPLSQDAVGDLPIEVRLTGGGVLTVVCPGPEGTSPALCGRDGGDVWTAALPASSTAVVLVQVDLAPPA